MRDEIATKAAHFADPDSYIENGHEYLEGFDRSRRRLDVFVRDGRRCVTCGEMTTWKTGEMHHKQGGLGKQRCDCLHNLEWRCGECHSKEHVQIKGRIKYGDSCWDRRTS